MAAVAILMFGIPLYGQQNQHPQPIPNWHDEGRWVVKGIGLRPCAIFEKDGKNYCWVEGPLPLGTPTKKRYSDGEIQKVLDDGGGVKILPHHFNRTDLKKQQDACEEWYRQQSH